MTAWWQLKDFLCSPLLGEDFQFDDHILQMGWFNHQLDDAGDFFLHQKLPHLWTDKSHKSQHFSRMA